MRGADRSDVAREFARTIVRARNRWRLRRVVEGLAVAWGVIAVTALVAVGIMDQWRFDPSVVSAARASAYVVGGVSLALLVLLRLRHRPDDGAVAAYLETHDPTLDALLLSAVEALPAAADQRAANTQVSAELARRLVGRARDRLVHRDPAGAIERRKLWRAVGGASGVLCVVVLILVWGPPGLRHGVRLLLFPTRDGPARSPYAIHVSPGNASVTQHADQLVVARANGFAPKHVRLLSRVVGADRWQQVAMTAGLESGRFEAILFNLESPTEYYVTGDGVESSHHRLDVAPAPTVRRIDLLYRYPTRSGRPPELVTDGGDIRAVRGTRVEVRVTPGQPLASGRLLVDGTHTVELSARDGRLEAALDVLQDGHYRVELPTEDGRPLPASPEYAIEALPDTMPSVAILRPRGDIRVSSVEEIQFQVQATDDVAVRELELVLSVNGMPEEIAPLARGTPPGPEVDALHTLFLEQRELAPGDLVAYYVRARDAADDPTRVVTSDIFFMEVRPFDRQFRQAGGEGGAGGGQGRGQQGDGALAAQQRQLVIALFKLKRDRASISDDAFEERVGALVVAQTRIRDRVDAIVRRIGARTIINVRPALERMAEELPKASAAMLRVEALLTARDTGEALSPARQALRHLQRADAAFREVQVARSDRQGGGGGATDDLANLFRLEMDKFRSQYEYVQRGRWDAPEEHIDEALRRLEELARRQQDELDRVERREALGRGGAESQRALAAQAEALVRALERLTRERPKDELRAALRAAREAARAMRRGATEGRSDQSRLALERLREASRILEGNRAREIDQALRRAESLSQRQSAVRRALEGKRGDESTVASVVEQKGEMIPDARELQSRLDRLGGGAGGTRQPDTARKLRAAANTLRAGDLPERIGRTRRMLAEDGAARTDEIEDHIARTLEGVRDQIAAAQSAAGAPELHRADSLERLRSLVRALDSMGERLRAEARAQSRAGGASGRGGATGIAGGADAAGGVARGGPAAGGVRGGGSGPDRADIRRRFIERAGELEALQRDLAPRGRITGEIEGVIQGLLAIGESPGDPGELAEQHARVLSTLKAIERMLRREAEPEAPSLVATDRAEVPDRYRELVDEYYRRLSEIDPAQSRTR